MDEPDPQPEPTKNRNYLSAIFITIMCVIFIIMKIKFGDKAAMIDISQEKLDELKELFLNRLNAMDNPDFVQQTKDWITELGYDATNIDKTHILIPTGSTLEEGKSESERIYTGHLVPNTSQEELFQNIGSLSINDVFREDNIKELFDTVMLLEITK